MKATFKCWKTSCKNHLDNGNEQRLKFEELKVRHEDTKHFDYVCPECEGVIICSERRLK